MKIIKLVPVKKEHKLSLVWVLPNYEKTYKTNPARLLSHVFGHEGENSLLSALMDAGLCESVSADQSDYMGLFNALDVTITLTELGYKSYE